MNNKRKIGYVLGVFILGVFALTAIGKFHTASAYELMGYSWPGSQPRVPYYVSTSLQGNVPYDGTDEQGIQAIQAAGEEWNTSGGTSFSFFYAGETEVNEVADDGINAIIFKDEECPYDMGCYGRMHYYNNNDTVHGFDIVLYSIEGVTGYTVYWSVKEFPRMWDTDIQSMILHEFGHALGLDHSFPGTVMGICGIGCSKRDLTWDDEDGIQALYDLQPNSGFWSSENSVEEGESFSLEIDYPQAANQRYSVLLSLSGMEGTPLRIFEPHDSRILAINEDFFPTQNHPGVFRAFNRRLDGRGQATAEVQLPSDAISQFGENLYFTVVTEDCRFLNCYEDVGVAAYVQITPNQGGGRRLKHLRWRTWP